jgi:hypothetical protein
MANAYYSGAPERQDEWVVFFADAFGRWLESLRRRLVGRTK